jgi:pimeloyl-ACP methyl ester carboxylesterase
MFYEVKGAGIPFCFQHGLSANRAQAKDTLGQLTDVQLIVADVPGHGASPLPPGQKAGFAYYTQEWIQLMDRLDLNQSIFGGISMGSGIALQLALQQAQRLKALVLVRPAWLDVGAPESLAILAKAAPYLHQKDGQAKFEKRADFQAFQKALPKAAASLLGVFGANQRPELDQVLSSMVADRPFSNMAELEKIQLPCLIIANEADPLHPVFMAEAIHEKIKNSQLELVTSKYLDQAQHQKEVLQLVEKFITQL